MSYEAALAEAERIVGRIQNGEIPVDELTREVGRATELLAALRQRLLKAEAEVDKLLE